MEGIHSNSTETDIKFVINQCFNIFNQYSWFTNAYVLDFYTENLWEKVLHSWRLFVQDLPPEIIAKLLEFAKPINLKERVVPLSMICLRQLLRNFCISRLPINFSYDSQESFTNNIKLMNIFWKKVNLKKRHEIMKTAEICCDRAKRSKCNYIIDIGAGLGHLSRVLSYTFGFNVLSIEADENLSKNAKTLDASFKNIVSKYLYDNKVGQVVYVNKKIQIDTTVCEIEQLLKKYFNCDHDIKFGIVGLHPCGDLAEALLRFYKESINVRFINIVNCCYMKLSTSNCLETSFPMSNFCIRNNYRLNYNSRELACHALEMYVDKLKSRQHWELKVHAYRASLEKIIVSIRPELRHSHLSNVKYTDGMTFPQYCKLAVQRLGLVLDNHSINWDESKKDLAKWQWVVHFYSLRLMLAPLIETIILLDRLLYLKECGGECAIVPVFDPMISPRNHVLSAVKI